MRTYLWACPITLTPNPIFLPPCIRTIKMRGCSKIAWMDAIRTTRYPLLSWCFAVISSKEFPVTKIYNGFTQVAYCMQNIFYSFSLDCKVEIWMVCHQIRLRCNDKFSFWLKKKEHEIFCSRMWTCIYRIKWCTVGMHNALARTGLETNSSWDVLLRKEKAPLLQWICWLKKSGIMICFHLLSCRWLYETFASAKSETS